MSAKNIFRKVFENFRVYKVKLRLRQALKKSFKKIEANSLICSYDKFPKRHRSKLRQICWKAAETIIEKNFGQFPGKIVDLHSTSFENILKVFRDNNFDLRLRQASEKSLNNSEAVLLNCGNNKFWDFPRRNSQLNWSIRPKRESWKVLQKIQGENVELRLRQVFRKSYNFSETKRLICRWKVLVTYGHIFQAKKVHWSQDDFL